MFLLLTGVFLLLPGVVFFLLTGFCFLLTATKNFTTPIHSQVVYDKKTRFPQISVPEVLVNVRNIAWHSLSSWRRHYHLAKKFCRIINYFPLSHTSTVMRNLISFSFFFCSFFFFLYIINIYLLGLAATYCAHKHVPQHTSD